MLRDSTGSAHLRAEADASYWLPGGADGGADDDGADDDGAATTRFLRLADQALTNLLHWVFTESVGAAL